MNGTEQLAAADALFREAIALSAEAREDLLERACRGLPALRREVDSLLGWDARTRSGFWSRPVGSRADTSLLLPPGARIGPYLIEESIGQGGMGAIYRARHVEEGGLVALKTVTAATAWAAESIRREVRALTRLEHPAIVRIFDDGLHEGIPWYAMELLRGLPWRTRVAELIHERAADRILLLFRKLCAPLALMHGEGIIHRDLKPENILVRPDDLPVIVDFGLTGSWSAAEGREQLGAGGIPAGTRGYASPEQRSGELVDARADLYSLGFMLREALIDTHASLGLPPDRSAAIAALVGDLCAENPRSRIGHAAQVAARLTALGAEDSEPFPAKTRNYVYRPPFVGRQQLVERFHAKLCEDGTAVIHVVLGESGSGKTRFISELAAGATRDGQQVVLGECPPADATRIGTAPPLQPFRGILQAMAVRCREGSGRDRRLAGSISALTVIEPSLEGLGPSTAHGTTSTENGLLASLRSAVSAFVGRRPLLMVLDDLQWADELSIRALELFLESGLLAEVPLRIVAAARSEELPPAMQRLLSRSDVIAERLPPMTLADVGRMVGEMLASRPPEGFIAYVSECAGGNPFFIAEYLRTAISQSWLALDDRGCWRVARGKHEMPLELPTPGTVQDLIALRLSRLSAGARAIVALASVLGRRESVAVLRSAAGDGFAEGDTLDLVASDVLELTRDGGFRFVHDKIRETVYGSLPAEERSRLHRSAAEAMESLPRPDRDSRLPALARHWEAAGDPVRASERYAAAGSRARQALTFGAAIEHYRSALRLAERDDPAFVRLCLDFSVVLERDHKLHESEELAALGRASARLRQDQRLEVEALIAQARAAHMRGRGDAALRILEEALPLASDQGEPETIGAIHLARAHVNQDQGRVADALEGYRIAIGFLRRVPSAKRLPAALANHADLLRERGMDREAMQALDEGLELVRRINDRRTEAGLLCNIGLIQHGRGELDTARSTLRQALRIAKLDPDRRSQGFIMSVLAGVELEAGALGKARTLYERAIVLLSLSEARLWEAAAKAGLAAVKRSAADLEGARALAVEAIRAVEPFGDGFEHAFCVVELARIELALGTDASSPHARAVAMADALEAAPASPLRKALGELSLAIERERR